MLTDTELSALRTDMTALLPETVIIERASLTRDSYGYPAETWTAVGTASGRIDPINSRNRDNLVIPDYERGRAYYQLSLAWDAGLVDGDRIAVDGARYQVIQVLNAHSKRAVLRAFICRVGT